MSQAPTRLFLIDGSAYVYRAFFALPPLSGPTGQPTNAVYGFTTMMLKLLNETKPAYLAVVFDAPGRTFRDDLFERYKANRAETPPDLTAQIAAVHQVVAGLRLHSIAVPGVEADDVIATLIRRFTAEGIECVIVTGDKDLMQLVGPKVQLWDTMRDRWFDEAAVEARWGVPPGKIVDLMALMGDPIDNIPGIKGIGEKTAVALIREFGDLENVLARLSEVERLKLRGAKKIAESLRLGADTARLSRQLATVKDDVEIACTLEACRVEPPDTAALRPLFTHLGFQSLLRQMSTSAPALTVEAELVDEPGRLLERLRAEGGPIALVACGEAGGGPTTPAHELVLALAEGRPLRVPLDRSDTREAVASVLADPHVRFIAHDLKRDLLLLGARGIELVGEVFDVMIASYLLEASTTHRLEELAGDELGAHLEAFRNGESAAAGVTVLRSLRDSFDARLSERGLTRLFEEVEMPLVRVLAKMEQHGMLIDVGRLQEMSREFGGRMETLTREVYALGGSEFNLNSSAQLRAVLFDKLQLSKKGVRRGKMGYSTDVDVLTRLAREHPLPAKLLEYRALAKLKSTYVDALPAAVNPVTGRLHTTFNQTVAATGRLSSSDPNLQNIPIRGEEGRRIREAFVAPPGHLLIAADYSQIELRLLAHLSGDPALIDAFRRDQDVHARTAAEVFGGAPDDVTSDMRRAAKVINFGIIYGMGPQRLAHELGIALAEAERYIASYFERYGGVRTYMRTVIEQARAAGYVTTMMGRRRGVPELRSKERGAAQAAERVATNTPIQGSAADLIKTAMVAVDRRLERERLHAALILQVHDELLLEVPEGEVDRVSAAVREEMEGVMALAVPLRIDLGVGRTWAAAH